MLTLYALISLVSLAGAEPQFHRVQNTHEGKPFYQEWIVDQDNKYVLIVSTNGHSRPSINLHDLEAGFSAIKDIEKGVCFLETSNHTIELFKQRLQELNNIAVAKGLQPFTWTCDQSPLTSQLVHTIAGERIAKFCNEYKTILVKRVPQEYNQKRSVTQQAKRKTYSCGFCVLSTNCPWPPL